MVVYHSFPLLSSLMLSLSLSLFPYSLLLLVIRFPYVVCSDFMLDQDNLDGCEQLVSRTKNICIRDDIYFQCPISCSEYYKKRVQTSRETSSLPIMANVRMKDPSAFYDLSVVNSRGRRVSLSRYEGRVMLLVVVPLLPGMGQYTIEVLERISNRHPYNLEIIALPVMDQDRPTTTRRGYAKEFLDFQPKSKVNVWEFIDDPHFHDVLKVLERNISPSKHYPFPVDVVTSYIISGDGNTIEKRISPTITDLERTIDHYIRQLNNEEEL